MSGHTPGPWFIDSGMPDVIVDDEGGVIAENVHELDTRLIAAAPDLLEALELILGVVSVRIDDPRIGLFDHARAAIAKATMPSPPAAPPTA